MVRHPLEGLGNDITHPGLLAVLAEIPRHEFVPRSERAAAYADHPLPIGHGQTISQPYIVALMTQALDPQPGDRVLEIGTGSGYQAAVLSRLVQHVFTIEIVEDLARRAATDLQRLGFQNVSVRQGDGHRGWPEAAPFDAIIVTCAPQRIPSVLTDQLVEGGRMIIPVGDALWGQDLYLLRKHHGRLERRSILPVRFVPMTGRPV
jgi:protein-L-isoaspartate(D-aspartate) O-methyltransferase